MGFNEPPSVGFFNRVDTQPLKNLHAHLIILPYYAKKFQYLPGITARKLYIINKINCIIYDTRCNPCFAMTRRLPVAGISIAGNISTVSGRCNKLALKSEKGNLLQGRYRVAYSTV